MPCARGVSVIASMSAVVLLTACGPGPRTDSASGSPSARPPAASTAAGTATPGPAPAASSATASAAASTSAPAPSGTPVPSRTSTPPDRGTATPAAARPGTFVPGCRNLAVSSAVKTAVTAAYRRGFPRFSHIAPAPNQFFYGQCGSVRYAGTRFLPTPGATGEELVALQDEGSARKYFRTASDGAWVYLATDGFPPGPHGCADVPQIPRDLAVAWRNCSTGY
ncbi:hypothetical protein [Streptomyces sp. NPDC004065]|uniref:hypothetical protein n=1 Tax=Streptomyces sp. NPDC004065 TaxID=3364689 RepID=UPI00384DFC9D